MRVGSVEVSTEGPRIATGTYLLKLLSVDEVPPSPQYPDSSPQALLKWQVMRSMDAEPDDEQEASVGQELWDYVAQWVGFTVAGQPSKLLQRIDALMGTRTPKPDDGQPGEAPIDDTDELINRMMVAAVAVEPNKAGRIRAKIVTVRPHKRRRPTAPEPDDDGFDMPF